MALGSVKKPSIPNFLYPVLVSLWSPVHTLPLNGNIHPQFYHAHRFRPKFQKFQVLLSMECSYYDFLRVRSQLSWLIKHCALPKSMYAGEFFKTEQLAEWMRDERFSVSLQNQKQCLFPHPYRFLIDWRK